MYNLLSYVEIDKKVAECHKKNNHAIAFIPVGCTEQHGPFLPIQTDTIIAEGFCKDLSQSIGDNFWCYVFPPVCYTPTKSNVSYSGTVSVDEELLRRYVKQICDNILQSTFDAIVLVSGHGPVDASLNEISFNLVHEQYQKTCNNIKPVFLLRLCECRPILERRLGQKTGQHADWVELVHLFHILGYRYFDEQRRNEIAEFQKNNDFPPNESLVLGIPMELRSVQGVVGNPLPFSDEELSAVVSIAWEETLKYLKNALTYKLNNFWN